MTKDEFEQRLSEDREGTIAGLSSLGMEVPNGLYTEEELEETFLMVVESFKKLTDEELVDLAKGLKIISE